MSNVLRWTVLHHLSLQVRNRLGSVPLGTPRDLLIQHRKRWLLPEEVLTAALDAFAYERPVSAVQVRAGHSKLRFRGSGFKMVQIVCFVTSIF
jgi:hypothetical protein